jgi:7,8-dihydropterin-6-yl-methyl-4-(beta-D-ribofuranosyl)aminobenzene 5'-phosphate synthase
MASKLQEVDSLEIFVIVDNELDPITSSHNAAVQQTGGLREVAARSQLPPVDRGGAAFELRMDKICCGAHGLSLMIVWPRNQLTAMIDFNPFPDSNKGRKETYTPV